MKTILVTGSTGFLGRRLATSLAEDGNLVHALYRSDDKIRGWKHEKIRFIKGTLGDKISIEQAMEGCRQVYHLAAFAGPWVRDPKVIYDENVGGTENILESAMRLGIEKLVYTSTAGVLGPSDGELNTEEKQFIGNHFTHYDRSKAEAETKVMEYVAGGLNAVIVNPTRIYGPGNLSKSNSVTLMIEKYIRGKWRIIPGDGSSIGNYVYVDDAVKCHLLAMARGRSGERYIAGGENLTFNELFMQFARVSGVKHRLFSMPVGLMMLVAGGFQVFARLTGWTPPIVPAFVRRYNHNWAVSNKKAKMELGYQPLSFDKGLEKTIEWIQNEYMP